MSSKSTTLALHEISLYNTGRISPEKIIAAFGARVEQFQRIMADLAAEKPKSRAQHHLIVGQRGMGKTMLLARIAAELRTDPALSPRFIPLVFAEEQYAVDRLSKFWLNCLDSLADAHEAAKDTKAVAEIDATVARLHSASIQAAKNDQPFADEVYAAFAKAAAATGQRPVLLVDNLQLVFERLDPGQQHSLRELLMRAGAPILVGASPSPPPQSQDYGAAFYDHFKVHYLRPLDEAEMRELLLHLAKAAERDDVRHRVLQHPHRLKILRQLTGGNPRTTLTLFFLYAEDFSPSVFGDLEGLLDRVTPLYKARFEELTPQQQVIVSAIANHWDPITAAGIASVTGMELGSTHATRRHARHHTSVNLAAGTISAQLDRLEKGGVIERTELFGETRTGYMISERFFNIWFLMRNASRRQRREVEFLTRFLETFYEPAERSSIARHLMGEDHLSADRIAWHFSVSKSLGHDPETAEELTRHTELVALREEARAARQHLHELIDFSQLPKATLDFAELRRKLIALVPTGSPVEPEDFAKAVLGDRAMFISGERDQLAAQSSRLSPTEIQSILDTVTKSREADVQDYSEEAVNWFSQRLATGQIRNNHDIEDWNRAFKQTEGKESLKLMVDSLPFGFGSKLSDTTFRRICALEPSEAANAGTWLIWGKDLHLKLARYAEAEGAYHKAIERCTIEIQLAHEAAQTVSASRQLLDSRRNKKSLQIDEQFERETKFITAHQRLCDALSGLHSAAWLVLGMLYHENLHRHAEAEAAYRKSIELDCNSRLTWNLLANLYRDFLANYKQSESAYRRAIECEPGQPSPWIGLGNLYCDFMDRAADANTAFDKALSLDPANDCALQNLLFLRRDFMGDVAATQPLMAELLALPKHNFPDTTLLHEALFAAYDANWGLACDAIGKAIALRTEGLAPNNTDDWLRASAVLFHLNYGAELIRFLDQLGDTTARLRPWVEALRASQIGDRRALLNLAPEIRTTAEIFYDGIERRLLKLPEKTRRRPLPEVKKIKTSRKRRK